MTNIIPSYDYVFKIIVVGDSGVGKTSLLNRICNNSQIEENSPTIGVEFQTKMEMVPFKYLKLSFLSIFSK